MSGMFQQFSAGLRAFDAPLDARLAFLRRSYLHLTGSVFAFAAISWWLMSAGVGEAMLRWLEPAPMRWLLVLGGFTLAGWMAAGMARSARSAGVQYAGLSLEVAAWSIVFAPLLFIARQFPGTLSTAAALTILGFGGLSAFVLVTRKDFSFLRTGLFVASLVALGLIVAGSIFGFNLGIWFSAGMILLAVGAILHDTSKVLHEYRTDQHVAAAVQLFAAVALLFWYVLVLLLQAQGGRRRD